MFLSDRISIPPRRQTHEAKNGLFSLCQRKYIKWRYVFCSKASTSKETVFWTVVGILIMVCVLSSHLKNNQSMLDTDDLHDMIRDHYDKAKQRSSSNSTKDKVYKTIQSWQLSQLSNSNDINKLPKLSPLRDSKWTSYDSNELFEWTEKPFNFVDKQLKLLDIENQKEFGYHSELNSKYGDLGTPIQLKGALREESSSTFNIHQINVVASNHMSLNRRLQEVRNPK